MSDRDYYEILGLTPRADGPMVDQAYWHLVRKYQTLAATNSRAQHMIDELNEAYGVLGNPRLREQYDAFRDDVLIRKGMVQPVPSKPKRTKAQQQEHDAKGRRGLALPSVRLPQHWRTYAISSVIALLAFAAAWQGVSIVLVVVALAAGLGLSLTPALTRRISEISFEMPQLELPAVPKLDFPKLSDLQVPGLRDLASNAAQKEEGIDADVLSRSTRDTIARWRKSVGLQAPQPGDAPSETLVEIVDAEKHFDTKDGDPFNAVMDILRSGAKSAPERTR
jgi:curved DNA-binding protein CbpA